MSAKFNVKITQKVMFDFLVYHTYTHVMGMVAVVFGLINLTIGIHALVNQGEKWIVYSIFGLIFLFGTPIMLWFTAGTSVKGTAIFQKPIEYELSDAGVRASQGEQGNVAPWESILRVTSTRNGIFLYQGKSNAIVLPRKEMGEQEAAVIEIISTHVDPSRVKIKR
ncbi:YcxB family protein [Lachnospiraceae bacterium OttesenSCG-928-E19]|nr:YcxB family protein [Lachnospiraceae bacterium OttesenSCG-928-E19]